MTMVKNLEPMLYLGMAHTLILGYYAQDAGNISGMQHQPQTCLSPGQPILFLFANIISILVSIIAKAYHCSFFFLSILEMEQSLEDQV